MIPGSRQPLVPRPELGARLDGDHRMALVSAPAGYGKTATLSSWADGRAASVAWLSCDPADAEPARSATPAFGPEHTASGAVDAHWGAGQVYEFYRRLGRDGLDGQGGRGSHRH